MGPIFSKMVNTTSLLSGGTVFDDKMFLKVSQSWSISSWGMMDYDIFLSLYSKKVFFDYSLRGYSHRERWARTRRYFLVKALELEKCRSVTPIGSEFYGWSNPKFFSQNLTATWDSRVTLSQRNSNAVTCHEGKTSGSVPCGLVYAHGCALLVCIRVYDAKKILVDALGTLGITGIHSL
jgi:hypothetical protein